MSSHDVKQPKRPRACTFTRDKIALFASHALDQQDTVQVQRHVERCAFCRSALQAYEELDSALRDLVQSSPSVEVALAFDDGIIAGVDELADPHVLESQEIWRPGGQLATFYETPSPGPPDIACAFALANPSDPCDISNQVMALSLTAVQPRLSDEILTQSLRIADHPQWSEEPDYSPNVACELRRLYAEPATDAAVWQKGANALASCDRDTGAAMSESQCLRAHYVQARAFMVQHDYTLARCHLDIALDLSLELGDFLASAECAFFIAAVDDRLGSSLSAVKHLELAVESLQIVPPRQRDADVSFELGVWTRLVIEESRYAPTTSLQALDHCFWVSDILLPL